MKCVCVSDGVCLCVEFSLRGCLKSTFKQLREYRNTCKRKEPEGAKDDSDLGGNELEEDGNTNNGRVEDKSSKVWFASTDDGTCMYLHGGFL